MYKQGRSTVGLILRTFTPKPDLVLERVRQVKTLMERALGTGLIRKVDILVWNDARYDDADCGKTAEMIRRDFSCCPGDVFVSEVKHADIFCGILNYGVSLQLRRGIDYSIIASSEALSYFTQENLDRMLEAASKGARAVGLAINELTESILAGRIANTCAMWDNMSLMQVGGFDLRAAKPMRSELTTYLRGYTWTPTGERKEVYYPLAGVEEVIPLVRLVDTFGQCIAPIKPVGEGAAYKVPDPNTDKAGYERHLKKMGTKFERQVALAASVGADLSYIEGGIMEGYRR